MDETSLPVNTPDGRLITAAAFGPHDGHPVISHHGTPGSRLLTPPDPGLLDRLGVRLIGFDRAGYGGSQPRPGRRVADAAADAAAVADAFGVHQFAVVGWSGGGPHALATAALLPERVTRCALLASVGPLDGPGLDFFAGMSQENIEEFDAALSGRAALEALLDPVAAAVTDDVGAFLAAFAAGLPPVDADLVRRPDFEQLLAELFSEALRPGIAGWVDDDLAFTRPWGFDPAAVTVPVGVWHGTDDVLVPVGHAGWLTSVIPGAEGHVTVGMGHLGVLNELDEVYTWLLG